MIHYRSIALLLAALVSLKASTAFEQNLRGLLNKEDVESRNASPGAAPGRILLSSKHKVAVEDTVPEDSGLPEYLTAESLPDALSRGAGELEDEEGDENGERLLHHKKKYYKKKKYHHKKKKKYHHKKKKYHHKKKKHCYYNKKGKYHCHK